MPGTEVWTDSEHGTVVLNDTGAGTEMVLSALQDQQPEVAALVRWGSQLRRGGLFERDRYVTPTKIFEQMQVAQDAAESDDVVAGVLESTEALVFQKMSVQCDDRDEEDIWNQIIDDIDLENRMREMWRELFTVSQFYVAQWWGSRSYKVRGKSKEGVKRKKTFSGIRIPTSIALLDPMKVVPVGDFMFGQEKLAWVADDIEGRQISEVLENRASNDSLEARIMTGQYKPSQSEEKRLTALGVNSRNLFIMDEKLTWRHSATRPNYKPLADIRMKSVFELLDMKVLLREMDRAHLLGATNFIILVKRGTDDKPAKQAEINSLQSQVRTLSKVPVIVGDHRIEIEIITPKIDLTLQADKWNVLDARITARLYQMFMTGNFAAGTRADDSLKLARIVARGLESRRYLLRRAVEKNILMPIFERNKELTELPTLIFHPKQIALDFDAGMAAMYRDLRDRREISRATFLEQMDLDQDEEAKRRVREEEEYDDIFDTLTALNDPKQAAELQLEAQKQQQKFQDDQGEKDRTFQDEQNEKTGQRQSDLETKKADTQVKLAQQKPDPKSGGRNGGGTNNGGGAAPGSGQGQPRDPRRGKKA